MMSEGVSSNTCAWLQAAKCSPKPKNTNTVSSSSGLNKQCRYRSLEKVRIAVNPEQGIQCQAEKMSRPLQVFQSQRFQISLTILRKCLPRLANESKVRSRNWILPVKGESVDPGRANQKIGVPVHQFRI